MWTANCHIIHLIFFVLLNTLNLCLTSICSESFGHDPYCFVLKGVLVNGLISWSVILTPNMLPNSEPLLTEM